MNCATKELRTDMAQKKNDKNDKNVEGLKKKKIKTNFEETLPVTITNWEFWEKVNEFGVCFNKASFNKLSKIISYNSYFDIYKQAISFTGKYSQRLV